jgi:hypothetical protein
MRTFKECKKKKSLKNVFKRVPLKIINNTSSLRSIRKKYYGCPYN